VLSCSLGCWTGQTTQISPECPEIFEFHRNNVFVFGTRVSHAKSLVYLEFKCHSEHSLDLECSSKPMCSRLGTQTGTVEKCLEF
jgi:hypothetical protein